MIELTIIVAGFIVIAGTIGGLFTLVSVVSHKKILRNLESRNEDLEKRLARIESVLEEERLRGLQLEDLEQPVEPFPTEQPKPGTPEPTGTPVYTRPKIPPPQRRDNQKR